jgi:tetratricopeptide (TPR) repeat protein
MKGYFKWFLVAPLALALILLSRTATNCSFAEEQQAKAAPAAQAQEEETPYDEVEYGAYETATKEPDAAKRGTMLLEFIQKYPKSALMPHINASYDALLRECSEGKKYELLESLSEKWLKIRPNDIRTLAFIAEATNNLQKYERCAECMEEIYKMQPSPTLAKDIFGHYQKINNLAKQLEWYDKLTKMPEFDSDFALRYGFVLKYMEAKNAPKAAEYCSATLKSTDLVKQPDAETKETLVKVRRACNHIIGLNMMEKDRFKEAIDAFQKALKVQKYGEGFYWVASCQERLGQEQVEDAIITYAKSELQGDEYAPKAKARLEQLYKALHNNTTIGIDKVYRKAKEELQLDK